MKKKKKKHQETPARNETDASVSSEHVLLVEKHDPKPTKNGHPINTSPQSHKLTESAIVDAADDTSMLSEASGIDNIDPTLPPPRDKKLRCSKNGIKKKMSSRKSFIAAYENDKISSSDCVALSVLLDDVAKARSGWQNSAEG